MKTINQIAQTVDQWITPPECQGQIVEYSYGTTDEGAVMVRRYDRSDRTTSYGMVDADEECEPWNRAPSGAVTWA